MSPPPDPPASPVEAPLVSPLELLEHAPTTAYLLRAEAGDFVLEGVNAAARAKTPALAAMIGRPISKLYADQPQIIADAQRCHRDRTRIVRETNVRRHERADGVRQVLVFVSVDADRIVIYGNESSDAATLNAELLEVQERYRGLVASLPDAVLLRGADRRVLACNDFAAQLFGHKQASDLWGRVDILAPGYRVETASGKPVIPGEGASQRAAKTGEAIRDELYRFFAPDGGQRWVRVSAQPLTKGDGSLGGSVTLFSDETERVLARHAERESATRLQLALDAGRMGTWEYHPETDFGQWSPNMDEAFKLTRHSEGFRGYLARTHHEDRAATARVMQDVLTQGDGATFDHEHRLVGEDGHTRWARIRGRVEVDQGRLRMLGTAMDVTELHRLQEERLHSSRLESLGRLAGGLAHDFNNLLAAMLASIELLGDACSEAGREDLTTLRHAAVRARDLTAQLLAFARQQRVELETVEMFNLVTKVERLLRRLVGPTIDLSLEGSPGLHVRADAAQLEQVLVNLVINARDAMPKGGRITIRVGAAEREAAGQQWVVLEVQDQGSGIDSETIAHVFDPFFTTKELGTGLGLASSYGVVQTHGGDITVESEPGRGACFRVRLPRAPQVLATSSPTSAAPSGKGRVLVVDDDAAVRISTSRMLKTLGYEVVMAADGNEAEALVARREGVLDFLVCDLAMPIKNGPEVARTVSQHYPAIKVLFVSGYPRGAERELPSASFLQKPYDRDALARKLTALAESA